MEIIPKEQNVYIQSDGKIEVFCGEAINDIKESLLQMPHRKLKYQVLGTPCAKIFKSDLVKMIGFNIKIKYLEDQVFNRMILNKCSKVVVVPYTWYYYLQNDFSALHSDRTEEKISEIMLDPNFLKAWSELNALECNLSTKKILYLKSMHYYSACVGFFVISRKMDFVKKMEYMNELYSEQIPLDFSEIVKYSELRKPSDKSLFLLIRFKNLFPLYFIKLFQLKIMKKT